MNLPCTPRMKEITQRVVWFSTPEQALAQPYLFMAHLMTYGMIPDVVYVRKQVGLEAFRETLEHAPPGVFDGRSWSYWHLICGRREPPPLPERRFS